MAVYATQEQLVSAVGEDHALRIADRDHDGEIDADVVTAALVDASQFIDSYIDDYLAHLVVVPVLTRACIWIATFMMSGSNQLTDDTKTNYKAAVTWLESIASGKATLPGQPNTDDGVIDPGDPAVSASDRIWNRRAALGLL